MAVAVVIAIVLVSRTWNGLRFCAHGSGALWGGLLVNGGRFCGVAQLDPRDECPTFGIGGQLPVAKASRRTSRGRSKTDKVSIWTGRGLR